MKLICGSPLQGGVDGWKCCNKMGYLVMIRMIGSQNYINMTAAQLKQVGYNYHNEEAKAKIAARGGLAPRELWG